MHFSIPFSLPRAAAALALAASLSSCVRVPAPPPTDSPAQPIPPSPRPLPPHPSPSPQPPAPAPPPTQSALPAPSVDGLFAAQTRLDRANCSPGGIDGRWGSKSEKALAAWRIINGSAASGPLGPADLAALGDTNGVLSSYSVSPADLASLSPYPSSWSDRSKMDRLGHSSVEELVAEKFHLYRAALRRINPSADWPNPPAGTVLAVPDVRSRPLPLLSKIEISLSRKTLRAYGPDGKLAAHFPCSIAADKAKRPEGQTLRVVVWAENPDYTFDPALFAGDPNAPADGKRLRIPPGPNNPVGVAWIGLDRPGYGIHGTPSPEDVSLTESHGCFRLTNWDAQKLVRAVRKDLPVVVLP